LQPSVNEAVAAQTHSVEAINTKYEIERNAKIVELESAIAQLKNAKSS
jgi:hypothetical protein